ncbi:MAG: DUF3843 family protein [Candidatus Amulumruptor caecigallinarius]|nr:DUF3843 family protein [Candidatus Amulumruptor caecigallinarius]
MKIELKEYLLRQPNFPNESKSDAYYLDVANHMLDNVENSQFARKISSGLLRKVILTLVDYLKDVVSDFGLWRSFVEANRSLYGWSVPFHDIPEEYVDYELNAEDVRFLVWYATSMLDETRRDIYPHNSELLEFANECFEFLNGVYEEAPVSEYAPDVRSLDLRDPEDHQNISHLTNWLYLHSYLVTPAFALTLSELYASAAASGEDLTVALNKELETAMNELPSGPLALFAPEWIWLFIKGTLPQVISKDADDENNVHPYYQLFVEATGGDTVKFFGSYDEMNNFFIDALGWEKGKRHLEGASLSNDFVLMVNKSKGMLMARDVCRCIKSPKNPYYSPDYAKRHAFELLTVRGRCPGDLLRRSLDEGWLPDAKFPGTEDYKLVKENADFIARCYLQLYYRD